MRIKIIALIAIMLFLSSSTVSATKVQKDDTWTYKDKENKDYDETALEVVQLVNTIVMPSDPIASIRLSTERPFGFDPNFIKGNFSTDLEIFNDGFYITQEGSIPIAGHDSKLNGTISFENTTLDVFNESILWKYSGQPATALVTTSSVQYTTLMSIEQINWRYMVHKKYLMTTNSDSGDKVKNFTVSLVSEFITFDFGSYKMVYDSSNSLGLRSLETAMLLSYEDGITHPIYVAQTEPALTSSGLTLSQVTELVEYYLVREGTNVETPLSITFLLGIFFLPYLAVFRKRETLKY